MSLASLSRRQQGRMGYDQRRQLNPELADRRSSSMSAAEGPDQRLPETVRSETAKQLRRSRRTAIHGVLVATDAPDLSSDPWVVDAIDISSRGLGLVLPPELLEGTRVFLSFHLGEHQLSRLPARVQHRMGNSGGVRFEEWSEADRLKLLEFLVEAYESMD